MTSATMDEINKALCYAHRNPGPGQKKTPFRVLQDGAKGKGSILPRTDFSPKAARVLFVTVFVFLFSAILELRLV